MFVEKLSDLIGSTCAHTEYRLDDDFPSNLALLESMGSTIAAIVTGISSWLDPRHKKVQLHFQVEKQCQESLHPN